MSVEDFIIKERFGEVSYLEFNNSKEMNLTNRLSLTFKREKDLEILGLSEGAKWTEIQDAFDKLSNEYDPNNNDDLDFFVEEFEKINKAYENLKDNYEENEQSRNDKKIFKQK